jgi:hypothetical protein
MVNSPGQRPSRRRPYKPAQCEHRFGDPGVAQKVQRNSGPQLNSGISAAAAAISDHAAVIVVLLPPIAATRPSRSPARGIGSGARLTRRASSLTPLVQSRHDKKAAKRLLRKLMKKQGRAPRVQLKIFWLWFPVG